MVAFSSSRRQSSRNHLPKANLVDALIETPQDAMSEPLDAAASRRNHVGVAVVRDRDGSISCVRIGRWRSLSAGPQRRLAEVRELGGHRVAIRIERFADSGDRPSSEIWQLYDLEGRLEAALQSTPDGRFGMLTNYKTRQACRLVRNGQNELEAVESWRI